MKSFVRPDIGTGKNWDDKHYSHGVVLGDTSVLVVDSLACWSGQVDHVQVNKSRQRGKFSFRTTPPFFFFLFCLLGDVTKKKHKGGRHTREAALIVAEEHIQQHDHDLKETDARGKFRDLGHCHR